MGIHNESAKKHRARMDKKHKRNNKIKAEFKGRVEELTSLRDVGEKYGALKSRRPSRASLDAIAERIQNEKERITREDVATDMIGRMEAACIKLGMEFETVAMPRTDTALSALIARVTEMEKKVAAAQKQAEEAAKSASVTTSSDTTQAVA